MTAFFEKSYKNTRTIHMCDLDEQGRLKNPPAKLPGDFCALTDTAAVTALLPENAPMECRSSASK